MERKKNERSNLEKKRLMFFQIGFVISLALTLIAFEWNSHEKRDVQLLGIPIDTYFEEEILNTYQEEKQKKIEPPVPEPLNFEIREDDYEIENEKLGWDTEMDPFEKVNIAIYDVPEEQVSDDPFTIVEDMPRFNNGGLAEFAKYVNKSLQYPSVAAEHGIQGKVYVQFIVNENGEVSNVQVVRGVDSLLDKEAARAVRSSPKWMPGKQRGLPVQARFIIPVHFKLNS